MTFKGTYTAIVTPFKGGKIDFDAYGALIERQIAANVEGIVPVGTTGESATMSHEEHMEVVSFAVKAVRKRCQLIAGAGSNATAEAVRLTAYAAEVGADGALLVSPYYNKPTQEGLYLHYRKIAESVKGFPLIVYNVPGRTGKAIEPVTVARLAAIEGIAALKEAGGSVDVVSDVLSRASITVLSGDDSLTVPMIAVGAKGVISVVSNLFPADVKACVDAALAGRPDEARALHARLLPVVRLIFVENNPMGVKTALSLMGVVPYEVRLPLCEMQPGNVERLKAALFAYQENG